MIDISLDRVMLKREIGVNELADRIGITNVNLSRIKTGKAKAMRFSTLNALCSVLECQPGDILKYR